MDAASRNNPNPLFSRPTLGRLTFALLAVAVGVMAGFGAVIFRALIGLFHNLLFLGQLSWRYDANLHTPGSPWGAGIVLVPMIGAAGVAFMVQRFAPEAKGHGVPEVMDAIYYAKGRIRPIVALVKALASALSIGSGGSVGREGPIIQIGAAFASTVAQRLRIPVWQRIALIGAGASGGIAATFNTPVGGILFAVEIVMLEVSARTLVPVALAAASATYVGRIFFGASPSFVIPALQTAYFHTESSWLLLGYAGLGLVIGGLSTVYVRSIYACEDFFERRIGGPYALRHILGMALVGSIFYILYRATGYYYIEGVGYSTVQDILSGRIASVSLLLLLCVLKLLATSLTLGSGASGGVFSPALYLGATVGAAYGLSLERLVPGLALSPPAFAVAGMAGLVGSSTGAALAAIVMIFEMTLDYSVIIPMTLTVALSYGVRRALCIESIYTLKLARRGRFLPGALAVSPHHAKRASELMDTQFETLAADSRLSEARRLLVEHAETSWFLVEDGGKTRGVVVRGDVLGASALHRADVAMAEIAQGRFAVVSERTPLLALLSRMYATGAPRVLVVRGTPPEGATPPVSSVIGLVTRERIADIVTQSSELFS